MNTFYKMAIVLAAGGALILSGLAFGPCVEKVALKNSLAGFRVTITNVSTAGLGTGTLDDPYDLSSDPVRFTFDASAFDQHGNLMTDFNGDVAMRVTPGELIQPELRVTFISGTVSNTQVQVKKVFGRTALWLEDIQTKNGDRVEGGSQTLQLTFKDGSYATGFSNLIFFKNPTFEQVQWDQDIQDNENIDTSALPDYFVEFDCRKGEASGLPEDDHGQLVVTGIFNEGFYVTDVAAETDSFNHMYAYNYSYPEDLEIGDRLDRLVGTSQDFSGGTQISFPAWHRAVDNNRDPLPFRVTDLDALIPPQILNAAICAEGGGSNQHLCGHSKKNWLMEAMESARVKLENVTAPDVFVNCDFNGDLNVVPDWLDASDPEAICSVACLKHDGSVTFAVKELIASQAAYNDIVVQSNVICPWEAAIPNIEPHCQLVRIGPVDDRSHICSELTTMRQFGQWIVALDDGSGAPFGDGPVMNILTQESLVDYDPTATENLGVVIPFVQGNLRHVRAARPRWVLLVGKLPGDAPPQMKP
ncbi:MAG: hypothetical protein JRJ87_11575 [Deltaproteobacteria bacterium]|nr:hypothetical protein [Deltaproteobacteria bacterium]